MFCNYTFHADSFRYIVIEKKNRNDQAIEIIAEEQRMNGMRKLDKKTQTK